MKKQTKRLTILSLLLVVIILAANVFTLASCNNGTNDTQDSSDAAQSQQMLAFKFEVVFADGKTQSFDIETDKKTVGEALLTEGLIAGDPSDYGLYVKTVCGETHEYNTDQMYWAFYINGEMAMTGVDSTNVTNGATYSFKAEK